MARLDGQSLVRRLLSVIGRIAMSEILVVAEEILADA